VAGTAGIVLSLLGLALVVTGAVVMTQKHVGLGLALAAGGFVVVVVGSRLSARSSGRA
jgi:hypothetical protein